MTLSKYKINNWYIGNEQEIDAEIYKIIYDMKNNISIPTFIPYSFSFNEEKLKSTLIVYFYKKYALNL